jgi:hypothetical protein
MATLPAVRPLNEPAASGGRTGMAARRCNSIGRMIESNATRQPPGLDCRALCSRCGVQLHGRASLEELRSLQGVMGFGQRPINSPGTHPFSCWRPQATPVAQPMPLKTLAISAIDPVRTRTHAHAHAHTIRTTRFNQPIRYHSFHTVTHAHTVRAPTSLPSQRQVQLLPTASRHHEDDGAVSGTMSTVVSLVAPWVVVVLCGTKQ